MSSARKPGGSARTKPSSAFTSGGSSARPTSTASGSRSSKPASSRPSSSKPTSSSRPSSKSNATSSKKTDRRNHGGLTSRASRSGRDSHSGPTKQVPQKSLMEIVRKRFTDDVFQSAAKAHPGWKVLIVDEPGMKVISAAVGMYDIMEQQVSIVESLEKKRAPFKDMAAIYILAPTGDSIKKLLCDFADKSKILYGSSVFVYFLGPIPKQLMGQMRECKPLVKRLKALAEINVDFLIREQRAFILDMNDPFASLYLRSGMSNTELKIVNKLVTLCATMNEYPYIRYKQNSNVCGTLASAFKLKMDEYVASNPSWWYNGSGNCPGTNVERDRSTLLLLDRSSDCLTPLMHDFNYQPMVNDLLTIDGDKITYKAESQDNPDIKEDKDVLLNDKDKLWVEMRGNHIAQVIEVLSGRIQEVVNSSTNSAVRKEKGSNMSLSQLASALKELPEYREVMSKLSQHMHIAHDCMDKFNKQGLLDLSEVEQTLATGKDEDKRNVNLSETISRCESILIRIQEPTDRLRLILIATISQGGLTRADKDRLLRAAQLGRKELQTLESLNRIGLKTVTNNPGNPDTFAGTEKQGFLAGLRNRSNSSDSYDEESEYANSWYVPPLKGILKALVSNQLSIDEYPSVIPMPPSSSSSSIGVASSARSTRKKGGATDKWGKARNSGQSKSKGSNIYDGGRNIVFMVGGLSFSELRLSRYIMEKESREIIAGATKFINPEEFIDDLKTLTD